jgi:protease-4
LEGNILLSLGTGTGYIYFKKIKTALVAAAGFDSGSNDSENMLLSLKDPIYKYSQECGPTGTKSKMQSMKSYAQDPNCIGVVLDIDSGGGQVSGTPEFYDASFKSQLLLILMD